MKDSEWIYMTEKMQDIRLFSRLMIVRSNQEYEMPAQHLELLSHLSTSDEKVTPMYLSKKMGVNKVIISRIIDTLSKNEYLIKVKDEADKRSYFVYITEGGRSKIDKIYKYYLSPIYELRKKLGEEDFHQMISFIEKSNLLMLNKGEGK
ncbi:MAG: MarR family winged helix-turn-helix transcriptional regulator [Peptostreptococcaceae bacterium]